MPKNAVKLVKDSGQPLIVNLKDFVKNFAITSPDFSSLPKGFPKSVNLSGLTSGEIGKFNAILTVWELNRPQRPQARSRVWDDPKGFMYLGVWQNAALLRVLVRKFTLTLPLKGGSKGNLSTTLNKPLEYRLKSQMDDAARSVKRNIEEGFKRPTTSEYLQFLGYSQASLEELRGDVRDCRTDGFLKSVPGSALKDKGFNLRVAKGPRKGQAKGEPTDPEHPYYQPLKTLDPKTLTYEQFTELINKTDWLLRKLVESLERKLESEQKAYQLEQARIRGNIKGR